uniref:Putative basic tail protein n=1 Tax=Ixodes ricinus TaxID=34613 RepID=A0A0K8RL11_IXORI
MLAATFFGVILACFAGEITCNEMKAMGKSIQSCNDDEFHDPGYSPGCMFPCTSGNGETSLQMKKYKNATVCVDLEENEDKKLHHIGICLSGKCTGHRERCPECTESQLQQRWSSLPELGAQFHRCPTLDQSTPVGNCLYICKDIYDEVEKEGYFYGIYKDGNPCRLTDSTEGECRSGWCCKK